MSCKRYDPHFHLSLTYLILRYWSQCYRWSFNYSLLLLLLHHYHHIGIKMLWVSQTSGFITPVNILHLLSIQSNPKWLISVILHVVKSLFCTYIRSSLVTYLSIWDIHACYGVDAEGGQTTWDAEHLTSKIQPIPSFWWSTVEGILSLSLFSHIYLIISLGNLWKSDIC